MLKVLPVWDNLCQHREHEDTQREKKKKNTAWPRTHSDQTTKDKVIRHVLRPFTGNVQNVSCMCLYSNTEGNIHSAHTSNLFISMKRKCVEGFFHQFLCLPYLKYCLFHYCELTATLLSAVFAAHILAVLMCTLTGHLIRYTCAILWNPVR